MTAELAELAEPVELADPAELPELPEGRVHGPLRLLPIPDTEPPPDAAPYAVRPVDRPGRDVEQPEQQSLALSLVAGPPVLRPPVAVQSFGPRPTPTRELPDPRAWTRQLVQAMVEVLSGARPPAQLARWTSPDVYAGLQRRISGHGLTARTGWGRRSVVRSVHVCEPADGVVEASTVLVGSERVRAIALRLEGVDGRWRMTAVQLG
jgi:hypothetical protein